MESSAPGVADDGRALELQLELAVEIDAQRAMATVTHITPGCTFLNN
jgi:hypothetical protein